MSVDTQTATDRLTRTFAEVERQIPDLDVDVEWGERPIVHAELDPRRLKRSGRLMVAAAIGAIVVAILGAVIVRASSGPGDISADGRRAHGAPVGAPSPSDPFRVDLPPTWNLTSKNLFPTTSPGSPRRSISMATYPLRPEASPNCDAPVSALDDLPADGAFISVREPPPLVIATDSRPPAAAFLPDAPPPAALEQCFNRATDFSLATRLFRDNGRTVEVWVATGADASRQTKAQIVRILRSLRVAAQDHVFDVAGITSTIADDGTRIVRCTPDGPDTHINGEDSRLQIPVAGPTGAVVGYIDRDLLGVCRADYMNAPPDGIDALPVRDTHGTLVGYEFPLLGFIDVQHARRPGYVAKQRAQRKAILCAANPTADGCGSG